MKTRIGLWIDHKKALIVFVADNNAETKLINSNLKKHHRQSGVATPADDIRLSGDGASGSAHTTLDRANASAKASV